MNDVLNIKNFNLKSFMQLLYCIIPLSLITGSFIPDLIVSLISILFLCHCIREKNFTYFKNKFFFIFILFYFIIILSSFVNNLLFENLIIFYIRFGIFVIATSYLIELDKKFINFLFFFTFFTFLILCIDSYIQYFFGINLSGNDYPGIYSNDFPRLNSFFGRKYKLGSFIIRLFPFLIFIFLINKKFNKFIIALLLLLLGVVFLSGERSSFLLLLVTFFFLFFYNKKFVIISATILFLLLNFFYFFSNYKNHKNRIIDFSTKILNLQKVEEESSSEIKFFKIVKKPYNLLNNEYKFIYSNSVLIFKDNLFIGAGPRSYEMNCKNYNSQACNTHPHQTYLQLLSETGLMGFAFIISIFFYSLFAYFKNLRNKSLISFIYLGIIINIWPITSSGSFFNNWLSVIIFFPLGFLLKNKS